MPEGKEADAYEVLGVEPAATSGEIKKRYWRLSLLIHPDKCAHPRANDAFQAVSKVSKDLQVRCIKPSLQLRSAAYVVTIATKAFCFCVTSTILTKYDESKLMR